MSTAVVEKPGTNSQDRAERVLEFARKLRPGERFAKSSVTWIDFKHILERLDAEQLRLRYAYRQGNLELMPTSLIHELWKKIIAAMLERYCDMAGIAYACFGNASLVNSEHWEEMLPDECYTIGNLDRVLPVPMTDNGSQLVPDLVIEIEVSRDITSRLPILAELGVAEVWRFDGEAVTVLELTADRGYLNRDGSRLVPAFPLAEVPRLAEVARIHGQSTAIRIFVSWLQANPVALGATS
jgi:Uma2 family endonuclease